MTLNDILTLLKLFAGFTLSFAAAFVIVIGLPILGICGSLKFILKGKL
jgi:hypothetical protein